MLASGAEKSSTPEGEGRGGEVESAASRSKLDELETETVASLRAKLEDETRRRLEAEAASDKLRSQLEKMREERDEAWTQATTANSALKKSEENELTLAEEIRELRKSLRVYVSFSAVLLHLARPQGYR